MFPKLFFSTLISTSLLLPTLAIAAATPTATTTDMAKDEWLRQLKVVAPTMICKSFIENEGVNKQMIAANINYDKCVTLIPMSFDKCEKQYYAKLPAIINSVNAGKWGTRIGECIGTDFAINNFTPAPSSLPASDATPTADPTSQ